jgi:hypothetical protein
MHAVARMPYGCKTYKVADALTKGLTRPAFEKCCVDIRLVPELSCLCFYVPKSVTRWCLCFDAYVLCSKGTCEQGSARMTAGECRHLPATLLGAVCAAGRQHVQLTHNMVTHIDVFGACM